MAKNMRYTLIATSIAASLLTMAACSGNTDSNQGAGEQTDAPVSINVLTNRTDLVDDGTFGRYADEFKVAYPNITVKFEGITDYEGEVKTRMSTENYGDVLGMVGTVNPDQYADFFEPLGTLEELEKDYRFIKTRVFDGQVYGIPALANVNGLVYNKKVWKDAGITDFPTSPAEFLKDLEAIKTKTEAIPFYTNYAADWPLGGQYDANKGEVSGNENFNKELPTVEAPWAEGQDLNVIDGLLYDIVKQGLAEVDPTTSDWELSKELLGTGKVGTMLLGSWAISQMQQAAIDNGANGEDIGYMPFPSQKDGKFYTNVGGDYYQAINKHSKSKDAARKWIDWFNKNSGYVETQGGFSSIVGSPDPSNMEEFTAAGVVMIEQAPAEPGKENELKDIDNAAEIGIDQSIYRKKLIEAASGQLKETKESIFKDLNKRWAAARAEVIQ